ncbi:MAG: Rv3654c family TadE-like protein [Nocardioidaceae bacterium]
MRAGATDRRCAEGSATLYVLSAMVLLMAVTLVVAGFAGLAAAKHRAAAAADLAALSAASTPAAGCQAAASTARRNGAQLTGCSIEGRDAFVTVVVVAEAPFGLRPHLRAQARAGPAR